MMEFTDTISMNLLSSALNRVKMEQVAGAGATLARVATVARAAARLRAP